MNLFSKENLMGAASLGVGAAAAKVVQKKVLPKVLGPTTPAYVSDLAPVAVGLVLPSLIKGRFAQGVGDGMIAVGVGALVEGLLTKMGNKPMGEVLLGEMDDAGVLMGAAEQDGGFSDFSSDSFDSSAAFAGEMDF
jgi:hypothetical protein